tara:strand:- start:22062 stop:23306 length:1245 start_codon:yes stop_codon:yes gene_type:complete
MKGQQQAADNLHSLSLRHLKAARATADCGSVTVAANSLNRSQSALTKALGELEGKLATRLFDRSSRGMTPTPKGDAFIQRIREAETQFAAAETIYRAYARGKYSAQHNPVFTLDVSRKRFAAFLALHETRDVLAAADSLGQTRAAVYSSIRHLEALLNLPLFEHTGPRPTSTVFGNVLASHTKLAFALIRHGIDELHSGDGVIQGSVVIGTLPYSRTVLTPRTIHRVLEAHPKLKISTREGPYAMLEAALRNGDLDLIIGATRDPGSGSNLATEVLFEDELSVIAGRDHPLAGAQTVTLPSLLEFGWVLPMHQTPARALFDQYLARESASPPAQIVETSSLSTVRGLLLASDRLALLSRHQVHFDEMAGLLVALPIHLEGTSRPIGITLRAHTTPSPAARLFCDELRNMTAVLD